MLAAPFRRYASFAKARIVREKQSHKSRGYGFISFLNAVDALAALRDVHGTYIGNRPVRLKRTELADKSMVEVRKRDRAQEKLLKR